MGIITMTETLAELVISEVKSKQILWDMKHKSYHNRLLVDREWSKIAENVGETNK
jgi:deoxyxylulose-5-phosphate synthase